MRKVRDWSIRGKLALVALSASGIALALASAAMIVADRVTMKQAMVHSLGTQADLIAANSTAALAFDNRADAAEILTSLQSEPTIARAALLDADGREIATYIADTTANDVPPEAAGPDGHWFDRDHLHLVRSVRLGDRLLGRLYLTAHQGPLESRLRLWLLTMAAVSLVSLGVAFLAAMRLQRIVSRPLRSLAEVAERVSSQRDYSMRAARAGADEVGLLVDTFNDMLGQIERRDAALQEAQSTLEERVKMRTLELQNEIGERQRSEEQKRRLQDMLERAERMKTVGVLAGGVAHDLNNMLGPVIGYAELVQRELSDRPELSKRLERVIRAAGNAAEVIQDLLTLGRRGRYDLGPVQLNDVIRKFLDSEAGGHVRQVHPDVGFELDLKPDLPLLAGSAPHLSKVIAHIVTNACEAMPTGGTLRITTSSEFRARLRGGFDKIPACEYVMVSVKDDGLGIPAEDLPRVFEPYFSKKKMGRSGTGLGLAVVYGVVKDHHGFVDVFSSEGVGTEFVLYFPQYLPEEPTAVEGAKELEGHGSVLVVDDHEEQCELAATILEQLGYQVHSAHSGHEAVEYLKQHRVDIVVLDMFLDPGFDGLDTYRQIVRLHPHQKAIVVSGYSETERVRALHRLGAGAYVRKPYTVETIGRALKAQLSDARQADGDPAPEREEAP